MPDMRLIVAGAGGRMGRTLVKAIADTNGVVLVGALVFVKVHANWKKRHGHVPVPHAG